LGFFCSCAAAGAAAARTPIEAATPVAKTLVIRFMFPPRAPLGALRQTMTTETTE
jgi:hypothetical protein